MIDWIQAVGVGIVIVFILGILIKIIPAFLEKEALAALGYLFEKGTPADDIWFCDTLKWAEAKYGPGTGAQ